MASDERHGPWSEPVLRITRVNAEGPLTTLRIEGRIDGAEVEELSRAASVAADGSARLLLDMSGVTFVDRAGVQLLQDLGARGAELQGCSNFIETLLNGESK
jgi:anti-anti-sigma regulatory factor